MDVVSKQQTFLLPDDVWRCFGLAGIPRENR